MGALTSTHTDNKMLYTEQDRPRGRGGRGGPARNVGGRQEQNRRHNRNANNSVELVGSRGSQSDAGNRKAKADTECWYCGKKGHKESECWKKCTHSNKSGLDFGRTEKGKKTMLD